MKKFITLLCVLTLGIAFSTNLSAQTVLFNQTFSTSFSDIAVSGSSTTLIDANYVSTSSPSISQFSAISTSSSANGVSHVSCDGNDLIFAREGGGSGWAVQDGGAAFGSGAGAVVAKFDFTPAGMLKTGTKVGFTFILGAMTSADQTSGPALSSTAANATAFLTIGCTNTDTIYVNNGTFNATAPFAPLHNGPATFPITFAVNNTLSSVSYTDPNGATQSLAAGLSDLWVGTTLESAGVAIANAANAITGFKLGLGNTGGSISSGTISTIKIDNLEIKTLGGGTAVKNSPLEPEMFSLAQNYPNPFNPSTQIRYTITKESFVLLKVYNLMGQEVATLVSGDQNAGSYTIPFDASRLCSGVYLYRLQAGTSVDVKRMLLIK